MASAWTSTDLARLEAAIARGVLRVEYQGQSVTYQSVEAMMRVREAIRRDLGVTDAQAGTIYAGRIG